jgi:hypothetical protein
MTEEILKEIKRLINNNLKEAKIDFDKHLDRIDQGWVEALELSLFIINDVEKKYKQQGKL